MATIIFDHTPPKTLNLYQYANNEAVSSICSGEMIDLEIPQSEWLRAFWPISQEQHFSQTENLYKNTENNINFHYKTNSVKIMTKFFFKFKTFFGPIFGPFPQFFEAKTVSKKIWHAQFNKVF